MSKYEEHKKSAEYYVRYSKADNYDGSLHINKSGVLLSIAYALLALTELIKEKEQK